MKKVGFFNSLALYIGGIYIDVFESIVIYTYYQFNIRTLNVKKVKREEYHKDGKLIITTWDNGNTIIKKRNYLDYNYKFHKMSKKHGE